MSNVKPGDTAKIVESTDGAMVGRIVKVLHWQGEHSKLGTIWRVRAALGELVTEYGGVGPECDCPDSWLRKFDPTQAANDAHFEAQVPA